MCDIAHPVFAMEMSSFEAAVRARTGLMDGPRFRSALRAALVGVAGQVEISWRRLGVILPRELFTALCEAGIEPLDPSTACHRVANAAQLQMHVAVEVVQAVVSELSARVSPDGIERGAIAAGEWSDFMHARTRGASLAPPRTAE